MLIRVSGGLGNQMFQYAFARKLNIVTGEKIYLDISVYDRDKKRKYELDKYNTCVVKVGRYIGHIVSFLLYFQRHLNLPLGDFCKIEVEKKVLHVQAVHEPRKYFIGNWQNEKYFSDIRQILMEDFRYLGVLSKSQKCLIAKMQCEDSVAVHVRRGDYLDKGIKEFYVTMSKEYYDCALNYISKKVRNPMIYFFSDDINWCKREYAHLENAVYIDDSISQTGTMDFEIMRNCKYFIIANSTFSWWASWLAEYEQKIVIAPKTWFYDGDACEDVRKALLSNAVLI